MPDNRFGFKFEKEVADNHILAITTYLNNKYGAGQKIKQTGNNYKNSIADLEYNGKQIEIKTVTAGSGTYANLSADKFAKNVGLPTFYELFRKEYITFLKNKNYDLAYKSRGSNLFSKEEAKDISEMYSWYDEFKELDSKLRKKYIAIIYNKIINDQSILTKIKKYTILKEGVKKDIADDYMVYNSVSKTIKVLTKDDLKKISKNNTIITKTDKGIDFGDFRIQLSWKNRTGYNLAIYVFLNK